MRGRFANAFRFPAAFPPVERVVVGTDRTIWVKLAGPGQSATWQAFDDRARVLGITRLPRSVDLVHVARGEVLAVAKGEYDEPIVVHYRMVRQ